MAPIKSLPNAGEDCLSSQLELHCGGVAANCAISLARWGVPVRLLGAVGRDAFAEVVLRILRAQGVDVSHVQRRERALTGIMYIVVTADGERTFFGSRGASGMVKPPANHTGCLRGAQAAHFVGYNFLTSATASTAEYLLRAMQKIGGATSLDVGSAPSLEIPRRILQVSRKVDILFVSLDEARALTGARSADGAFEALQRAGAREVIVKLGSRGCLIHEAGRLHRVPSLPVATVDTTGAGDAFVGAYLQARWRGWPASEAALLANAAGAAAAAVVGAGEMMPGADRILALLRRARLDRQWDPVRRKVVDRLNLKVKSRRTPSPGGSSAS